MARMAEFVFNDKWQQLTTGAESGLYQVTNGITALTGSDSEPSENAIYIEIDKVLEFGLHTVLYGKSITPENGYARAVVLFNR